MTGTEREAMTLDTPDFERIASALEDFADDLEEQGIYTSTGDLRDQAENLRKYAQRVSRAAEPVAYVVTPKNPAFGPSLVFKPGEFASEYALIEPLYGQQPEPARDANGWRAISELPDDMRLVLAVCADRRCMPWRADLLTRNLRGPTPDHLRFPAIKFTMLDRVIDAAMAQESGDE